jgi:hypothetical protein
MFKIFGRIHPRPGEITHKVRFIPACPIDFVCLLGATSRYIFLFERGAPFSPMDESPKEDENPQFRSGLYFEGKPSGINLSLRSDCHNWHLTGSLKHFFRAARKKRYENLLCKYLTLLLRVKASIVNGHF